MHKSIGTLSKQTGVNIETIRYYERIGLLPAPPRTQGGRRAYDDQYIQRLIFVRRSRELGFTIADVRALVEMADRTNLASADAKVLALRHLANVRDKIKSLKELENALMGMTAACSPGANRPCPIFQALNVSS